jgi:hypothetical protein
MFDEQLLRKQLKIKTLDERTDLPIYGQSPRVRTRTTQNGWQEVRLLLRDFKDVDKAAFRKFLSAAANSYARALETFSEKKEEGLPWETDGQSWHLSQKNVGKPHLLRWKPATLMAMVGRFKKIEPKIDVDWSGKVLIRLFAPGMECPAARIVTNLPQGIRVELTAPRGAVTPTMVERLGNEPVIKPFGSYDSVRFWMTSLENNDGRQLHEVWSRCRGAATGQSEPFAPAKDESSSDAAEIQPRSIALSG